MENNTKSKIVTIFSWLSAILITIFAIYVFFIMAKRGYDTQVWLPIAQKHFATVVGLPMAGIASFLIVLVLEYVSGKINFEVLGLKFNGAASQIVFWILCYLTIVLSIKLTWNLV